MNLWHVVRVDTPNGKRIGIVEATEAGGMDQLTAFPLDEADAIIASNRWSETLQIPPFDNGVDEYRG